MQGSNWPNILPAQGKSPAKSHFECNDLLAEHLEWVNHDFKAAFSECRNSEIKRVLISQILHKALLAHAITELDLVKDSLVPSLT